MSPTRIKKGDRSPDLPAFMHSALRRLPNETHAVRFCFTRVHEQGNNQIGWCCLAKAESHGSFHPGHPKQRQDTGGQIDDKWACWSCCRHPSRSWRCSQPSAGPQEQQVHRIEHCSNDRAKAGPTLASCSTDASQRRVAHDVLERRLVRGGIAWHEQVPQRIGRQCKTLHSPSLRRRSIAVLGKERPLPVHRRHLRRRNCRATPMR